MRAGRLTVVAKIIMSGRDVDRNDSENVGGRAAGIHHKKSGVDSAADCGHRAQAFETIGKKMGLRFVRQCERHQFLHATDAGTQGRA